MSRSSHDPRAAALRCTLERFVFAVCLDERALLAEGEPGPDREGERDALDQQRRHLPAPTSARPRRKTSEEPPLGYVAASGNGCDRELGTRGAARCKPRRHAISPRQIRPGTENGPGEPTGLSMYPDLRYAVCDRLPSGWLPVK